MFRICKAELRKIFLRPSIFVVTGLLILVLALSSFLYSPNKRDTVIVTAPSTYNSVSGYNTYFNNASNSESFAKYNELLSKAENDLIEFYKKGNDYRQELLALIGESDSTNATSLVGAYNEFRTAYTNYLANPESSSSLTTLNQKRSNLKKLFEDFRTTYNQNVVNNTNQEQKKVLSTTNLNLKVLDFLSKCITAFDKSTEDINLYIIEQVGNQLKFRETLTDYVNQLVPYIVDAELVSSFNEYITQTALRLGVEKHASGNYVNINNLSDEALKNIATLDEVDNIYNKIRWYKLKFGNGDSNTNKQNIEEFRKLLTEYKLTVQYTYDLIRNGIDLLVLNQYDNSYIQQFKGYENVNYYQKFEFQNKLSYLYDTETFEFNYANPFSISQPSNYDINCYDFSYFALRLCMFVIVVYIIVIAATTIVGELSSGTIKMLAIRPYSRTKLLAGKLLATFVIGLIIIAVSAIATWIMGALIYGVGSMPILVVLNAEVAFSMPAFILYLLFVFSLIIEMSFFMVVALAISMLFKSQIVSVAVSILFYFGTLVLNTLSTNIGFLKYLPFTNVNIFKYFGSAFLSTEGGFLEAVLTPSVVLGADLFFSTFLVDFTLLALLVLCFILFKKRDIK